MYSRLKKFLLTCGSIIDRMFTDLASLIRAYQQLFYFLNKSFTNEAINCTKTPSCLNLLIKVADECWYYSSCQPLLLIMINGFIEVMFRRLHRMLTSQFKCTLSCYFPKHQFFAITLSSKHYYLLVTISCLYNNHMCLWLKNITKYTALYLRVC